MDNAQKAIMIGVGLFITIIVIAAVMAITGIGTNLLNQGQDQLGGLSAQLEQQLTAEYDDVQKSGAQVIAAIQKYYNDPKMVVHVYNKAGTYTSKIATPNTVPVTTPTSTTLVVKATGPLVPTVVSPATRTALSAFTSTSSDELTRVVTTGQYKAQLIRYNDVVVGVSFFRI